MKDIGVRGKKGLERVDLNVSFDDKGNITSNFRIKDSEI
jgi:3-phosphoglycerate kinase